MKIPYHAICSFVAIGMTAGCGRNPNVEIVGSYFPGWMISLALGVALTFVAHAFFSRKKIDTALGHPVVIYPALVLLFTCLLWLAFFA